MKEFIGRAIVPILVREWLKEQQAQQVNWNATEFWIDGGCLGNEAHGKREAYGSISDGRTVERLQFVEPGRTTKRSTRC